MKFGRLDSTRNLVISCSVLSLMEELMFKLTQYPIKIFKLRSEIISSNNEITFLNTKCWKLILKKLVFFISITVINYQRFSWNSQLSFTIPGKEGSVLQLCDSFTFSSLVYLLNWRFRKTQNVLMTVLFANSLLLISGDLRVTRLKYLRNKVCYNIFLVQKFLFFYY